MKIKVEKDNILISDFSDIQVFSIAMKIESDGEKFYSSALAHATDDRMKRTFKRLAEDEKVHFNTFKALFDAEVRAKGKEPADIDYEEGLFSYMDSGIFSDKTSANSAKETVLDGEIAELKSILFYKEMLKNTANESAKKALAEIIDQEQMHLNILKSWEAVI
jgi:rubrerythrin